MGLELFTRVHNVIKSKNYYVSVCAERQKKKIMIIMYNVLVRNFQILMDLSIVMKK